MGVLLCQIRFGLRSRHGSTVVWGFCFVKFGAGEVDFCPEAAGFPRGPGEITGLSSRDSRLRGNDVRGVREWRGRVRDSPSTRSTSHVHVAEYRRPSACRRGFRLAGSFLLCAAYRVNRYVVDAVGG